MSSRIPQSTARHALWMVLVAAVAGCFKGGNPGGGGGNPDAGARDTGTSRDGGSTRDSGPPYSGDPVPLGSLDTVYAEVFCRKVYGCCDAAGAEEVFGGFGGITDENDCITTFTGLLGGLVASAQSESELGRVTYDPNAAGDCFEAVSKIDCADLYAGFDPQAIDVTACQETFTPHVSNGSACGNGVSCVSQNCNTDTSLCAAVPGEGDPCDFDCEDGLYCDRNDVCAPLLANGTACLSSDSCESDYCNQDLSSPACAAAPQICGL